MKTFSAIALLFFASQALAENTPSDSEIIEIDTQFCGSQEKPVGLRINSYHALHHVPPVGNWLVATESPVQLIKDGFFYKQTMPVSSVIYGTGVPITSNNKAKCLRYLSVHKRWTDDMFSEGIYEMMPSLKQPSLKQYKNMKTPLLRKITMITPK